MVTEGILSASRNTVDAAREYCSLCKPRVTALIVFTAIAGMLIAPAPVPLAVFLGTVAGIALVSGSAASVNAILEVRTDGLMDRTRQRALPSGRLTVRQAAAAAVLTGATGLLILYNVVNALTMWLALATFFGYGIVYTLLLKPYTAQNIVIGGAAGAMPPVLGWTAATGSISLEPLLLFLIVFVWTPPHFWSLALYYRRDYARGGFPMLPVTRGTAHTCLNILIYTGVLLVVSLLPVFAGSSGAVYLLAALALGVEFVRRAARLYRAYSEAEALATFRCSIVYLFLLFSALIIDHFAAPHLSAWMG